MLLEYKTKTDINGNSLKLVIDTEKKTVNKSYFLWLHNPVTVSKQKLGKLYNECIENGYRKL